MLTSLLVFAQIISIGDYYQLPPVSGSPPYKNSNVAKGIAGRAFIVETFDRFFELTHPNFRQLRDPELNDICTAARFCTAPTQQMLDRVNRRYVDVEVATTSTSHEALWTASTWNIVNKLNDDHFKLHRAAGKTVVNLWARLELSISLLLVSLKLKKQLSPV